MQTKNAWCFPAGKGEADERPFLPPVGERSRPLYAALRVTARYATSGTNLR
jgi:hypothetical protein